MFLDLFETFVENFICVLDSLEIFENILLVFLVSLETIVEDLICVLNLC